MAFYLLVASILAGGLWSYHFECNSRRKYYGTGVIVSTVLVAALGGMTVWSVPEEMMNRYGLWCLLVIYLSVFATAWIVDVISRRIVKNRT